jgi:hypothetical protein
MKSITKQLRSNEVNVWTNIRYKIHKYLITRIYNVFYQSYKDEIIERYSAMYDIINKFKGKKL